MFPDIFLKCRYPLQSGSSLLCTSAGCIGEWRGRSQVLPCIATYSYPSHAWNSNFYCLVVLLDKIRASQSRLLRKKTKRGQAAHNHNRQCSSVSNHFLSFSQCKSKQYCILVLLPRIKYQCKRAALAAGCQGSLLQPGFVHQLNTYILRMHWNLECLLRSSWKLKAESIWG